MKNLIFLAVGFCLSGAAWAAAPIDAGALGGVDAAVAVCGKMNPTGVAAYGKLRESVVGDDVSPEDVEAAVQTPEYRNAYEATLKNSEAQPHDVAAKACADLAHNFVKRSAIVHPTPKMGNARPASAAKTPAAKTTSARPAGSPPQ